VRSPLGGPLPSIPVRRHDGGVPDPPVQHRVVIVGGGFAGLYAARDLGRDKFVEVTLVDRRNYHLFQPLLYQVATGALSPGDIAQPLRAILRRNQNTRVLLGEAVGLDPGARRVELSDGGTIDYDTLIVATGARHAYFGHDEWARLAPGLKTIEDATDIRHRILIAYEAAERETDAARRAEWMTFVVVGAGPTGVELAGALGEISHDTLRRDFRSIHPADARVLLVEALDRVLPTYPEKLSTSARRQLERLGVTVRTSTRVTSIDDSGIEVAVRSLGSDDVTERIPARTVVWAAGVQASSFGRRVAEALGVETDRAGRVPVGPDLTVAGHPEIMVLGDLAVATRQGGKMVPGVAPAAIQEGKYAAKSIRRRIRGRPADPFKYRDRGDVAVIGRLSGVADIRWLGRFGRMSGFLAWGMWLGIHILYLIGFANRLVVIIRWAWSFLTHGRGTRLITGEPHLPPIKQPERPD
jgi:NADH:ubiquinone reductase (H+-translocating)